MADFKRGTRIRATWPDGSVIELLFESMSKFKVNAALATWLAAQAEGATTDRPAMIGFALEGHELHDVVDGIKLYLAHHAGPERTPVPMAAEATPPATPPEPVPAPNAAPVPNTLPTPEPAPVPASTPVAPRAEPAASAAVSPSAAAPTASPELAVEATLAPPRPEAAVELVPGVADPVSDVADPVPAPPAPARSAAETDPEDDDDDWDDWD